MANPMVLILAGAPADYVALVIPGGRAPNYIWNNADRLRILR